MEHPSDVSQLTAVGFTTIEIPRENLGNVLLDLHKNEALVKSAETVTVIPAKSFVPFKFTFQKIQKPGVYLTSANDSIAMATVYSKTTSLWNRFTLVTRYLTNDSAAVERTFVDTKRNN